MKRLHSETLRAQDELRLHLDQVIRGPRNESVFSRSAKVPQSVVYRFRSRIRPTVTFDTFIRLANECGYKVVLVNASE
jgi:hypothetical protein